MSASKEELGFREPLPIRNIMECTEFAEMDSRMNGAGRGSLSPVDSRLRGNDGSGRLERAYCLDTPCATAGTGPLAMAGFRRNDKGQAGGHFPSFPRKRESRRFELQGSNPGPSLRSRSLAVAALMVTLCAVSACAPPSLRDLARSAGDAVGAAATAMQPSQKASGDPLLDFLAEAEEGEVRDFDDAATGTRLRVSAGRRYHAASGQLCRRYSSMESAAVPEAKEEGLVCREASGRWIRADLLAPVPP